MKIYELRDETDEESYFVKGFFSTKERAIEEASKEDAYQLCDFFDGDDFARFGVYEWELDEFSDVAGNGVKVFEIEFKREYDEEKDDNVWSSTVTRGKSE